MSDASETTDDSAGRSGRSRSRRRGGRERGVHGSDSKQHVPFPARLRGALELSVKLADGEGCRIADWNEDGHGFVVFNPERFSKDVMPSFFNTSSFASFIRLCCMYKFGRRKEGSSVIFTQRDGHFVRDKPELDPKSSTGSDTLATRSRPKGTRKQRGGKTKAQVTERTAGASRSGGASTAAAESAPASAAGVPEGKRVHASSGPAGGSVPTGACGDATSDGTRASFVKPSERLKADQRRTSQRGSPRSRGPVSPPLAFASWHGGANSKGETIPLSHVVGPEAPAPLYGGAGGDAHDDDVGADDPAPWQATEAYMQDATRELGAARQRKPPSVSKAARERATVPPLVASPPREPSAPRPPVWDIYVPQEKPVPLQATTLERAVSGLSQTSIDWDRHDFGDASSDAVFDARMSPGVGDASADTLISPGLISPGLWSYPGGGAGAGTSSTGVERFCGDDMQDNDLARGESEATEDSMVDDVMLSLPRISASR